MPCTPRVRMASTVPVFDLKVTTPSLQAFQRTPAGRHLIPITPFPLPYTDRTQQVILQVLPTQEPPEKRHKKSSLPAPPPKSTGGVTRSRQAPIFVHDMTPQKAQRSRSTRQRQRRTGVTAPNPPRTTRDTTPLDATWGRRQKRTRYPSPRSLYRQALSPPPLKKLRNRLRQQHV